MEKIKPVLEPGKRIVMAISAHPDDNEFRCGGLMALWSKLGDSIITLSITDGCSGTFYESREVIRARRRKEAKNAVGVIGGRTMTLGCIDGELEPSLENRLKLIRLIREIQPDIIITNRANDYHPDHRYANQLIQDASYMLQVPNVASDVPPMRYVPLIMFWGDCFRFPYTFSPKMIVDIDSVVDTKVRMLMQHESQMFEWLPWVDNILDQVPSKEDGDAARFAWVMALYKRRAVPTYADRFRDMLVERYGEERGRSIVEAEAFEPCEYGYKASKEELELVFSGV